jgi:hypothetical protein
VSLREVWIGIAILERLALISLAKTNMIRLRNESVKGRGLNVPQKGE